MGFAFVAALALTAGTATASAAVTAAAAAMGIRQGNIRETLLRNGRLGFEVDPEPG
jgi:hypothetical protein